MKNNKEIYENCYGCVPLGTFALVFVVVLILLIFGSCKPTQKIVEVEKWAHDTTTIVDTVHIKDVVIQHDSIFTTEYITQFVKDSTLTNIAWKHYTYDDKGNVTSLTDYTSSTQHGSTAQTAAENASSSVNNKVITHEETGKHSESNGHLGAFQSKQQEKVGLSKWQKFVMLVGYISLAILAFAVACGGIRLYKRAKIKGKG